MSLTKRVVHLKKTGIPIEELNKSTALESDTVQIINEPSLLLYENEPIISYGKLPQSPNLEAIRYHCKTIHYYKTERIQGLKTESRVIGFTTRNVLRADYCSSCSLARVSPKQHSLICGYAKYLEDIYKNDFPSVYEQHRAQVVSSVLPEWTFGGTIFTSGIVNRTSSLKYHYDTGNFKNAMSCMLVLKKDIQGGMLSLPEYGVRLDLKDSTYLIFNGQNILHGVTPIKRLNKNSYRYSIVFYSLEKMKSCLPAKEELERIRLVAKTRNEMRMKDKRTINDI